MTSPQIRQTAQTTQDLLADIFGTNDAPSASAPAAAPANKVDDIMSLFGGGGSSAPAQQQPRPVPSNNDFFSSSSSPVPAQPSSLTAFMSPISGLTISFTPTKDATKPNVVNITTTFSTSAATSSPITGLNFQAAVPKTMKLQMMAISNADLYPGGKAETQLMRVLVPPGAPIRLRLRLAYTYMGEQRQEQSDFAFPSGSV